LGGAVHAAQPASETVLAARTNRRAWFRDIRNSNDHPLLRDRSSRASSYTSGGGKVWSNAFVPSAFSAPLGAPGTTKMVDFRFTRFAADGIDCTGRAASLD
jgi:hypothetical protein